MIANPYSPEIVFDYISDQKLEELLSRPYPVDIKNPRFGYVNLSKYFGLINVRLMTNKGPKYRSMVEVKETYLSVSEEERSEAFENLCNFLSRFNRPHRDILFAVPKHPDVEQDRELDVINIYYKVPEFEVEIQQNEAESMIRISFEDKNLYERLLTYCLGPNYCPVTNEPVLLFSYKCFRGFILQY